MSTTLFRSNRSSFPLGFYLYPDSILNPGSLLLLDFGATGGYDGGSAVPTAGVTMLPNVAYAAAARLLGSGTRESLSPIWTQTGLAGEASSLHKVEWTPGKGLHTIVSQANTIQGKSCGIQLPAAILAHIFAATPGSDFYISHWQRATRAQVLASDSQPFAYLTSDSGATANHLFYNNRSTGIITPGSDDYVDPAGFNGTVPSLWATRVNAWAGTKPGSTGNVSQKIWNVGSAGAWSTFNTTHCASAILYRLYIENLTVSGRSFAAVRAADQALFTAAFSNGGRFYNDTYTAPSTIP